MLLFPLQNISSLTASGHDCSAYRQDTSPTARLALARSLPSAIRGMLVLGEGDCLPHNLAVVSQYALWCPMRHIGKFFVSMLLVKVLVCEQSLFIGEG